MPLPSPAPPRRQTIKQARASFKSRGQPTLMDREKRQLEREIELDRRAWRAKEAEKRKVEAARKRLEKEKEERKEVMVEAERRCDRFGFLGSQMHIGAFFDGRSRQEQDLGKENVAAAEGCEEFEDDALDDESLGAALDGTNEVQREGPLVRSIHMLSHDAVPYRRQLETISPAVSKAEKLTSINAAFESFWEELDSSTQIARDLASDDLPEQEARQNYVEDSCTMSFGSDSFDLTVEDLEELESSAEMVVTRAEESRELMPPPPLPTKCPQTSLQPLELRACATKIAANSPKPAPRLAVSLDVGFTTSQLEHFVDDNLQLTQDEPD